MDACSDHNTPPDVPFDGLSADYRRRLAAVIAINAVMFVVEFGAGQLSGSQALKADALDFAGDTATYGISGLVVDLVERASTKVPGPLAFLVGTLRALAQYRVRPVRICIDGSPVFEGPLVLATASNGLEAVKKYKELKPDFVTLDLVMPQMGGIQTLVLLKKIDPSAVVIMVSSMSGKDKIVECARAGASHYILKPFEEDKVAEVLNKVVFAQA